MKPIICNCTNCRGHRSTRRALVSAKRKAARHAVRYALKPHVLNRRMWETLPVAFYVGGTDWALYQRVIG